MGPRRRKDRSPGLQCFPSPGLARAANKQDTRATEVTDIFALCCLPGRQPTRAFAELGDALLMPSSVNGRSVGPKASSLTMVVLDSWRFARTQTPPVLLKSA